MVTSDVMAMNEDALFNMDQQLNPELLEQRTSEFSVPIRTTNTARVKLSAIGLAEFLQLF